MLVTPALCEAETGGSLISRTAGATQNKKEERKSIGLGRMRRQNSRHIRTWGFSSSCHRLYTMEGPLVLVLHPLHMLGLPSCTRKVPGSGLGPLRILDVSSTCQSVALPFQL